MALFLVQHGLSLPKDQDPEKGLSKKGVENTKKIAEVAKFYEIQVSTIVHSGKKRAKETALIFSETLGIKRPSEQIDDIKPMDDVKAFCDKTELKSGLMIVGHLPFLEKFVSYIITGQQDLRIYKFQNSGIVCLDHEQDNWFIKWTLNPDIS
jgi:phosphohistidine phosphatase